ncbi:MAG: thioredoxin domain-containing protein [Bacteroidetes bacterium]|nr:thioredoxin domain-containing protein [Bacteroidota bacterium]
MKTNAVANFTEGILNNSYQQPVIAYYQAEWSSPCYKMGVILTALAQKAAGTWVLASIDVDKNREITQKQGIRGVPHLQIFFEGQKIASLVGVHTQETIEKWLNAALNKHQLVNVKNPENEGINPENEGINPENEGINPENEGINPENEGINPNPENEGINPENEAKEVEANLISNSSIDNFQTLDLDYIADLEKELILLVNQHRANANLAPLLQNSVLLNAASDHVAYQVQTQKLSHQQAVEGKKTVIDRVQFYGGDFFNVVELLQQKGLAQHQKGGVTRYVLPSATGLAREILSLWQNSVSHNTYLFNANLSHIGLAVAASQAGNSLFVTLVLGRD